MLIMIKDSMNKFDGLFPGAACKLCMGMMSLYMSTHKGTGMYDEESNVVSIAVYRDYLH